MCVGRAVGGGLGGSTSTQGISSRSGMIVQSLADDGGGSQSTYSSNSTSSPSEVARTTSSPSSKPSSLRRAATCKVYYTCFVRRQKSHERDNSTHPSCQHVLSVGRGPRETVEIYGLELDRGERPLEREALVLRTRLAHCERAGVFTHLSQLETLQILKLLLLLFALQVHQALDCPRAKVPNRRRRMRFLLSIVRNRW